MADFSIFSSISSKKKAREDEQNIGKPGDTRGFLVENWENAVKSHKLSNSEQQLSEGYVSSRTFQEYISKEQHEARRHGVPWKINLLSNAVQLARQLALFESMLDDLIITKADENDDEFTEVKVVDVSPLWQLAYLNVKFSSSSATKFKLVTKWMNDLRRNLELLVQAVRDSTDRPDRDLNPVRMELLEVFDPILGIMHDSVVYLQRHYNEDDFSRNWITFMDGKVKENLETIRATREHLREVDRNSILDKIQSKHYVTELGIRDRIIPMDGSEKAIFPLDNLPQIRVENFTGRGEDIDRLHRWLGAPEPFSIRKYHIYGRRGIGKTWVAMEYARQYRKHYDAVFWIQCETKASLRQSFAEIANKLELEGADMNTNFDENLMRVLRWLRHTDKKWLLIYDNAERENLLQGYWPAGGRGSMLLTSRSYYNFFDDENRHGETVKFLNDAERRELFLTLLGPSWTSQHLSDDSMMVGIESAAIDTLLRRTNGLPIAIYHAAKLILDTNIIKSQTAREFMETFQERYRHLPSRPLGDRDDVIKSLDTIWAIAFHNLQEDAMKILTCLAHLAPDSVYIDLFLPSDQRRLTQILDFCRVGSAIEDPGNTGPSIQTIIHQAPKLYDALGELQRKGLIRITGRRISMHRTVQDAINFDLLSYEAMVNLLYDAFPIQVDGRPLTDSWGWCRVWIQHVLQLSYRYKSYTRDRADDEYPLKGMSPESIGLFVRLLANCSWYLFEIAEYDECLTLISIARSAATDKTSLDWAHLMNTEGTTYYELNYLAKSKAAMETCLEIRNVLLPPDHAERAVVLANLGNVETAEGNYEQALEYLRQGAEIREAMGDDAATLLAVNYMQIGRVYALQDNKTDAYQMYQKCEGILNRRVGRNKFYNAHLHYEYGNLQFKQEEFTEASISYQQSRQMAQDYNPMHPLVAVACYKLGCVEFEQDHHKKALNYLHKALDIAEVRSPAVIDGNRARITWKIAEVMLEDPLGERRMDAAKNKEEYEDKLRDIADMQGVDLGEEVTKAEGDRERFFDQLVPGYFR